MMYFHKYVLLVKPKCTILNISRTSKQLCNNKRNCVRIPEYLKPPKKPLPIFLRYLEYFKRNLIDQNVDKSYADLMKIAAEEWKKADRYVKSTILINYYKDVEKYEENVNAFYSNLTEEQLDIIKKYESMKKHQNYVKRLRKMAKDMNMPKRPPNSFALFVQSKKSDLNNINAIDYMANVASEWKALSSEDKEKFRIKALSLRNEYLLKLEKRKAELGVENVERLKDIGNKTKET